MITVIIKTDSGHWNAKDADIIFVLLEEGKLYTNTNSREYCLKYMIVKLLECGTGITSSVFYFKYNTSSTFL